MCYDFNCIKIKSEFNTKYSDLNLFIKKFLDVIREVNKLRYDNF